MAPQQPSKGKALSLAFSSLALPGDRLKCSLAAAAVGQPLAISDLDTAAPIGSGCLLQIDPDHVLFDANAVVCYLLGFSSFSTEQQTATLSWLEWERTKLQPLAGSQPVATAKSPELKHLQTYLVSHKASLGSAAADLVVFASVYSIFGADTKQYAPYPQLSIWFQTLEKKHHAALTSVPASTTAAVDSKARSAAAGPVKTKAGIHITLDHHTRTVLPKPNERNILITSALPYVNNVPHLGNIIGCVLSADVYARFCRIRGYNTLYICGTDEYGTATETKALEEKTTPKALCDKYHAIHKSVYEWFKIDFDHFGRTTTDQQTTISQDIFNRIDKNGYILEDTMTQLYCEKHSSFLADRYVEGTCPLCGYVGARGDQCDGCGKLLNATELKDPHCILDNATPVIKTSKHLFINLEKLQSKCEDWVQESSVKGKWSTNSCTITNGWLREGLRPRCITRDLKWGTAVPREGYEKKVFYVWFDAPIGYPSITANYTKDWEQWWKNPEHVQLYQFMGKDNVPFHTVIFPCSLLGTGEPWTMLHHLSTTEYLQYEGGKFSKSRGVGVFGNNVMDSGIPPSVWRYYLLSNRPESNDSQFTWESFAMANNNELLANFGNFVNRVVKFIGAKYDSVIPAFTTTEAPEVKLIESVNQKVAEYIEALESVKIRHALKVLMDISALGNEYLQSNKIDNSLFLNARSRCDTVVAVAANLVYLLGSLAYPYMPDTSESIFRQLNTPSRRILDDWQADEILAGHTIGSPEYLFKRIEKDQESALREKYAGKQVPSETNAAATSSSAKKAADKKKKASVAPALPNEAPAGIEKTPAIIDLEAKIKETGDSIRQKKADKADIGDDLVQLKELKTQLAAEIAKQQ